MLNAIHIKGNIFEVCNKDSKSVNADDTAELYIQTDNAVLILM